MASFYAYIFCITETLIKFYHIYGRTYHTGQEATMAFDIISALN